MKTTPKSEALEALVSYPKEPKSKFKALLALLLQHRSATEAQKRYYNAVGYSASTLSSLEYDIKKLNYIKDTELNAVRKAVLPPKEVSETAEELLLAIDPKASREEILKAGTRLASSLGFTVPTPDPLPTFSDGITGTKERKDLIEMLELTSPSNKKKDQEKTINDHYKKVKKGSEDLFIKGILESREVLIKTLSEEHEAAKESLSEAFASAPDDVKTGIKLRDEFTFLSADDCPDKFKILVADKITAYINYRDARKEAKELIAKGASNEDLFEIAVKAVENFELNLEIYEELNYYKEHGEILGEHPIFKEDVLNATVGNYSTVELTKRQKNLRTYISRDSKKLEKMEDGPGKDEFSVKLEEWKHELALIDKRLEKIS